MHLVSNILFVLGTLLLIYLAVGIVVGYTLAAKKNFEIKVKPEFIAFVGLWFVAAFVSRYFGF